MSECAGSGQKGRRARGSRLVIGWLGAEVPVAGFCEGKRVHVSEICPAGGAVVFMREEGSSSAEPFNCLYRGTRERLGKI